MRLSALLNSRRILRLQLFAAIVTGFSLSLVPLDMNALNPLGDPIASWQASAAFAKGVKTQDMPAVAPSYGSIDFNSKTPAAQKNNNVDPASVGHSTMTIKVSPSLLQGGAVRSGITGGAQSKPVLEGNILRETAPDDVFAAAGIAQTDVVQKKPKPAKVSEDVYRSWLSKTHPQFSLKIQSLDPMQVLELKGQWDKADRTLKNLGIPHTTIGAGQLAGTDLSRTKVLVVNCAGTLNRNALQGIRDFVARGGYLLTTDWALDNMLRQTFPGFVEWNKGKSKGNVVDAQVVMPDREFFQGTVSNASWKLDEESQTVRVLRPDVVKVLAVSRDLAPLDPDRKGILAVAFPFGNGKVLHMVGHFDNNSLPFFPRHLPDPAPVIGIGLRQALAANFVLAGLQRGK